MVIKSTSVFRESAKRLSQKKKQQYHTCFDDICDELRAKTVVELVDNNNQLNKKNDTCLIKMRVANTARREGQSGGFRVIAFADIVNDKITLLEIFPKTGKYRKDNLSDQELKEVLNVFLSERKQSELKTHDLTDSLKLLETGM